MGGREVGGLANQLSAHRDLENPQHRAEIAGLWGVADVAGRSGKSAVKCFEAVRTGRHQNTLIVVPIPSNRCRTGTDPRSMKNAELVIVQEAYQPPRPATMRTCCCRRRHGARKKHRHQFERRITHFKSVLPKLAEALHDWKLRRSCTETGTCNRPGPIRCFPMRARRNMERASLIDPRTRPDIPGLSFKILEERGPQQWRSPKAPSSGKKRLYRRRHFSRLKAAGRNSSIPVYHRLPIGSMRVPVHLTTGVCAINGTA